MADRDCRECRELISAFLDGEATGEENVRLRQHLATCEDCRATLDAYRGIGGSLRTLPAVHAPRHLTESIFARTIDGEPRRLFLITSRVGYSLAAVASVLLIFVVAAYLIIGGYQRGIDPTVASSSPPTSTATGEKIVWPVTKPVEITFNKEMNRESVIAALGMQPPLEKERLSHSWDGNTLIIGGNPAFKPETSYEIKISTDATDRWGNPLKEPFAFAFTTSTTQTTVPTPTPQAEPTATIEQTAPTQAAVSTSPVTPSPTSDTPDRDDGPSATPTAQGSDNPGSGTGNGTEVIPVDPVAPTPTTAQSTPTTTPIEPTAEPEPTSTPTAQPTATATVTPPPTATSTATPTATATDTPSTPGPIPVTGAIGDVYWSDQTVQDRLGKATTPVRSYETEQLEFQNGVMLINEDRTDIYVLMFGAGWSTSGAPDAPYPTASDGPDEGIYIPGGVFGALWANEPAISNEIGHALTIDPYVFTGYVQSFVGGVMLETPTTVYVIYDGGAWDWFTHNSGS